MAQAFRFRIFLLAISGLLSAFCLLSACGWSDKSAKDYQLMETVHKKSAAIDQQKIADLRQEVQALQREVDKERLARTTAEGRAADAERRLDMQREELARAKDEKLQAGFLGKQLTDELAHARDDRSQVTQTNRQLQQQLAELKQALAEMSREKERLQAIEMALDKQTKELLTLEGTVRETLAQAPKKTKPVKTPKASEAQSSEKSRTIVVKEGQTLASLAREHGVTVAQLKELNHLTTDQLSPGQKLLVPESSSAPPTTPGSQQPNRPGKDESR